MEIAQERTSRSPNGDSDASTCSVYDKAFLQRGPEKNPCPQLSRHELGARNFWKLGNGDIQLGFTMREEKTQGKGNLPREQSVRNLDSFWSWGGCYVGYRLSDSLFSSDGKQIGFFAPGDEVYSCAGQYLGEVRGGDRLITNPMKKQWTRTSVSPDVQRKVPGHPNLTAKTMLANFEDFRIAGLANAPGA